MNSDLFRRISHRRLKSRAVSDSCKSGGFYKSPTAGQSINALEDLTIQWDTSCLAGVSKVDIYLNAQKTASPRLHKFEGADFAAGSYVTQLKPKWWNATDSVDLSLAIVPYGQPDFMNDLPAGPIFTATYDAPEDGTVPEAADTSIKDNDNGITVAGAAQTSASSGLSPGKTAAAVLVPLLFVIAIGVLAYLKISRQRRQEKSNRFSQAIDKRMSTISADWKSMTPSGATAAVRASMHQGDRASMYQQDNAARFSTFSYSNRPSSSVNAYEGGQAGLGARGMYTHENASIGDFDYVNGYSPSPRSTSANVMRPSFSQSRVSFADATPPSHLRTSRVSFAEGTRQSRVSFADGTRPSVDSRRSIYSQNTMGERNSRAYYFDVAADAPPVPIRKPSDDSENGNIGLMSPQQTNGPFQLTPEEINTKATAISNEDEDVGAAITYMRSNDKTDVLFAVPPTPGPTAMPSPPESAYSPALGSGVFAQQQESSPVAISPLGPMPMLPAEPESGENTTGGKYMTPDDMLKAYAQGKRDGNAAPSNGGMRQLYGSAPSTPNSATPMMRQAGHVAKQSSGWDGDAYGGTAA